MSLLKEYFQSFRKERNNYQKQALINHFLLAGFGIWTLGGLITICVLATGFDMAYTWLLIPYAVVAFFLGHFGFWHAGRIDDGYYGHKYE